MNSTLKKTFVAALALFCGTSVHLMAQAGGAAVPFLLISPDARAGGMGEVGTGIADNVNAIYWNPGGLGFQTKRQIALSYSKWLPQFNAELDYGYFTAGQHFEELDGMVAINAIFMNLGEFTRTDESGRTLGKFRSNEFALGIAYGGRISEDIGYGVQLRYIQSNLAPATSGQAAGTGQSGGFDLGFLWKPSDLNIGGWDISDKIGLGINLQNVGPKMTYRAESDPLPTTLRLGTSFNLLRDEFNDLTLAADFAKLLVKRNPDGTSDPVPTSFITAWDRGGIETSVGAEYWYEQVFALRAGYFTEPVSVGNRQFITFGAGVRYDIFNLDFSFINTIEENHPLANTMRFSFIVDWL
jgi:opacity protein-like surface antigen